VIARAIRTNDVKPVRIAKPKAYLARSNNGGRK
jgi:hypothetical protein